ncbi:MAG: fimbrillin family protein [Bacteroidales bacterium]|nr:fimbrillin family protein [Bacteroidales bacterium]
MKQSKLLWLAAAGFALAACSSDELMDGPAQNPKALSFDNVRVQSSNPTTSRAQDVETNNLMEFTVWADYTKDGVTTTVFDKQDVNRASATDAWAYTPTQYWTIATYNFYALAPVAAVPADFKIADMVLKYTNAGDEDLVYAQNVGLDVNSDAYGAVSLTFKHMLTRVRFQLRNKFTDGSTIEVKSIEIDNAVKSASLSLADPAVWTGHADNLALQFIDVDANGDNVPLEVEPEETATEKVYSLYHYIIPTLDTERTYNVKFQIIRADGTTEGQNVAITKTFEAGKSYNIITDIKDKAIYFADIEVEGWSDWQSDENEDPETPVEEPTDLPEGAQDLLEMTSKVEFASDGATVTWENNVLTYDNGENYGNAAVSWLEGAETDLSGYEYLVLELEEASSRADAMDVNVGVSNYGYWGDVSETNLAAGETKLEIKLADLKNNNKEESEHYGEAIDLTKVNMIYLKTNGWCQSQVIKVKNLYLAKAEENPFEPEDPKEDGDLVEVPAGAMNLLAETPVAVWNGDNLTWDNYTMTFQLGQEENGDDSYGNGALCWLNAATDLSEYESVVLEIEANEQPVQFGVGIGGFWSTTLTTYDAGTTKIEVKLADTNLDLALIDAVILKTNDWTHAQTIKVRGLYITKASGNTDDPKEDDPKEEDPEEPSEGETLDLLKTAPFGLHNADALSWDANTNTMTVDFGDDDDGNEIWANAAYAWEVTDIADYKTLVIELEEAQYLEVNVTNSLINVYGDCYQEVLTDGATKLEMDLSKVTFENPIGVFIRSAWCNTQTIKIKSLYLTK